MISDSEIDFKKKYYRTFNFEHVYFLGWRAACIQHDFLGTSFRVIFVPIEFDRKTLANFNEMLDYLNNDRGCIVSPHYYDSRYPLCICCDFLN